MKRINPFAKLILSAFVFLAGCNRPDFTKDNFSTKPIRETAGYTTASHNESISLPLPEEKIVAAVQESYGEKDSESVLTHLQNNVGKLNIENVKELEAEFVQVSEPEIATEAEPELHVAETPPQKIPVESTPIGAVEDLGSEFETIEGPMVDVTEESEPVLLVELPEVITEEMEPVEIHDNRMPEVADRPGQETPVAEGQKTVFSHLQKVIGERQAEHIRKQRMDR